VAKAYEDVGVSGAQDRRVGLDALKSDAAKGRFDVVVVWKFDRLARSTSHLLETLALLQRYAIDFVSVTEAVDTSTPAGKMVTTFLAAVSEFERALITERVVCGLERAKAEGVRLGRPRIGFDVHEALRMKREGRSWNQLSKHLNVSSATLRRMLPPLLKNLTPENAEGVCSNT
jgi:DNA invertase Pin-like site-specific DNA recombinase